MDSCSGTIQTNEESQLNMGNTYKMMAGSYMEELVQYQDV